MATSLSSIELTLQRIKRFGLGNSSKAVAKCVQDLRDAACSTELKLEALDSWQQQGLLDDIDAFKPLVEELLVAVPDHSLSPQVNKPSRLDRGLQRHLPNSGSFVHTAQQITTGP